MSKEVLDWWSNWSNGLGVTAVTLGGIVAIISIIAWGFAWKAGKLKDEALKRFQESSNIEISKANSKAAIANSAAATANEEAGKANERAAKLEKDAAALRERAAQAELELAKIQNSLAWRSISPLQEDRFVKFLALEPKSKVEMTYLSNDQEVMPFAERLAEVLRHAGYDAPASCKEMNSGIFGGAVGVTIIVKDKNNISAVALQRAFEMIGIEAYGILEPHMGDEIEVRIGQKPK